MNKNSSLLNEFHQQSKQDWIEKASADLKGSSLESIQNEIEPGLSTPAYLTTEDIDDCEPILTNQSGTNAIAPRYWINYQEVMVASEVIANDEALEALNMGAQGIIFNIQHIPDFERLLADIKIANCSISFLSKVPLEGFQQAHADYVKSLNINSDISGFINISG